MLFYVVENQTFRYFEPIISKVGYKMTFLVVYAQTTELYPTEVRGLAFGITNSVGRIGAIASVTYNSLTFFQVTYISAIMYIIAWVLSFFVRETKGLRLTDRIDEKQTLAPEAQAKALRKSQARASQASDPEIDNPFHK